MAKLKIVKVSDLPLMNNVFNGMKTIIAYNRQNYLLDVSKIKGKKIIDINGFSSDEPGGDNLIIIKFDDGSSETLHVYNGNTGDKGKDGPEGVHGDQGEDAIINYKLKNELGNGIEDVLYIVNNTTTSDGYSLPWSAYRGKILYNQVYELNETFLTEEEFANLFTNIKYIYAEFITKTDNKESAIFNNDVNDHLVYKKYWTYEDTELETYYIYNPNLDVTDEDGNVIKTYDPVVADLWKDIYLGSKEGYFPVTDSMANDSTIIYYFDQSTLQYEEVTKIDHEFATESRYIGDKKIDKYYISEIDAFVSAEYNYLNRKWKFNLITGPEGEIVPDIYVTEDGIHYTQLTRDEVLAIDPDSLSDYYTKGKNDDGEDEYNRIENITSFLAVKDLRYYLLGNDNQYYEVEKSDINFVEAGDIVSTHITPYIISSRDSVTNVYTFTKVYTKQVYDDIVVFADEISINSIDLYYYTTDRTYYRMSIETIQPENEGDPIIYNRIYTPIEIPSWIYAEFKTYDEDVLSLILNANNLPVEEDNTQEDSTEEDLNTNIDIKNIIRIVPGIKKDLYHKNSDGTYSLFDLNKDQIYSTAEYFVIADQPQYIEITGDYAKSNAISILYVLNTDGSYTLNEGEIIDENIYYIQIPAYEKVNDPNEYLTQYNLTLFKGEPQILPIAIYPNTAYRSYVNIEYDSDKIMFFEDGRIAAILGNNITTPIIIRSAADPNIYAIINVTLVTPMKEISLDESNVYEVDINESVVIRYSFGPDDTTNKNIIWSQLNDNGNPSVTIEKVADEDAIIITGIKKDNITIQGIAEDNLGAVVSFNFEIIQPAESMIWDQDNITYHPPVYYTTDEINKYNNLDHVDEIAAGLLEPLTETSEKEPAYYSMVVLKGLKYLLDPIITPVDTSYKQIVWESSDYNIAEVVSENVDVEIEPEVSHIATQADVDNNLAENIGDIVIDSPRKTEKQLKYFLTSSNIGEVVISGYLERYPDLMIVVNIRVDQSIEEILIYPEVLSMNVNTSKKLVAEVLPDTAINGTFEWVSSNPEIVEVGPTGTITAKAPGVTTVFAKAKDGSGVENNATITVTIPMKDIILYGDDSINGIIYVGIGQTVTIKAETLYMDEFETGTKLGINWSSSDEEIATIDENGVVSGLALGSTTIVANAKDGSGVFGTIKVQVIKLIEDIQFSINEINMEIGDTLVLVPNITPDDASNEVVIWASSDETVAKVKQSGIVYALSSGTCEVTATTTDGTNKVATCSITVIE